MDKRGLGSWMGMTVLPPTILLLVPGMEAVLDCAALMASRSTVSALGSSALDANGDPSIPARVAPVLMRASLLLILELIPVPVPVPVCVFSLGMTMDFAASCWILLPLPDMERLRAKAVDSW